MIDKYAAGKKLGEFRFPVEKGKIREFADAICDPNPIYRDSDYARKRGFRDVIVPPTFLAYAYNFYVPSEIDLMEALLQIGMNPTTRVHGGVEVFYQRPVCAGETLRGEITLGNIYEKKKMQGGKLTFVESEIKMYDEENKLVANARDTFIDRGEPRN